MMLPNGAPTTSSSSAVSRDGAVADFIYALSSPPSLTGRPSAETLDFSWQVLELDATFPEMLRLDITNGGDDFPSKHALGIARSLCADLDRILPRVISFSDLEAFEGDLLLHWRSDSRSVTVICPANSMRPAKLFREQLDNGRTAKTHIAPNPRASDLAKAIQWVWNRD
jgi:hypothetical protein